MSHMHLNLFIALFLSVSLSIRSSQKKAATTVQYLIEFDKVYTIGKPNDDGFGRELIKL